jgi:hypothetical protein
MDSLQGWQLVAILVSGIGIAGAALLYYVSKIFQVPEAERVVKGELLEAGLNMALALFIFFIFMQAFSYFGVMYAKQAMDYSGMSFSDPDMASRIGSCSIVSCSVMPAEIVGKIIYSEQVRGCLEKYMQSSLMLYSMFSGMYGIQASNLEITGAPTDAFVTTFQNMHLQSLNAYFLLIFTVKALAFMNAFGPALIALGVALRAFMPTRSAGAFLVAMGLGMMFVFPMAYMLMLGNFYDDSSQMCRLSGEIDRIAGLGSLEDSIGIARDNPLAFPVSFLYSSAKVLEVVAYILGGASGFLVEGISRTMVTMCITPFAAFAITMTFINIVTSILGGRISEIGRGLFRLV